MLCPGLILIETRDDRVNRTKQGPRGSSADKILRNDRTDDREVREEGTLERDGSDDGDKGKVNIVNEDSIGFSRFSLSRKWCWNDAEVPPGP